MISGRFTPDSGGASRWMERFQAAMPDNHLEFLLPAGNDFSLRLEPQLDVSDTFGENLDSF